MRYDDAIQGMDDSNLVSRIQYADYIKPLLSRSPRTDFLLAFYALARQAWMLGIQTADIREVRYVGAMCKQIVDADAELFTVVAAHMIKELHNATTRMTAAERVNYNSRESAKTDARAAGLKDLYRTLFEDQFRLWGTIPFLYATVCHGLESQACDGEAYVNIAAGTKFYALTKNAIPCSYGNVKNVLRGFDNDVRNAGGGHEDWELDDNNCLALSVHNPKTGKLRKVITYSLSDFEKLIEVCRKSLWILETGFLVYLNNNPELFRSLARPRPLKVSEITAYVTQFASDRWFGVNRLTINKDRKVVDLQLQSRPKMLGSNTQVYMPRGRSFDTIIVCYRETLENQVLGICQFLVACLEDNESPALCVQVLARDGSIVGAIEYDCSKLRETLTSRTPTDKPAPKGGGLPDKECVMLGEQYVPYGYKQHAEKVLREKGVEIVQDPSKIDFW